ncbi:PGF-CTERM sorting domain-containing protein [Natrialbaceae archaeon GCM10025810]|uniref:PGF-CTERM sorting domain-containing protein n=1 Tax=Halovalidus salilacus TaxID=3075124 RepID=UPI00360A3C97
MSFSDTTKAVLGIALLTILLASFLAIGTAAADNEELANESVTFDNESNVTVSVDWNESIDDVDNASADVSVYNGTEYDDDPANATEVLTDEIDAEENETTETEYTEDDDLEDGEEYRVLVDADDTEADDVTIDDGSVGGGGWFGGDGSNEGGSAIAGLAIITLAIGAAWKIKGDDR